MHYIYDTQTITLFSSKAGLLWKEIWKYYIQLVWYTAQFHTVHPITLYIRPSEPLSIVTAPQSLRVQCLLAPALFLILVSIPMPPISLLTIVFLVFYLFPVLLTLGTHNSVLRTTVCSFLIMFPLQAKWQSHTVV